MVYIETLTDIQKVYRYILIDNYFFKAVNFKKNCVSMSYDEFSLNV